METFIIIVVLATSVWVAADASAIGVKKGHLEGLLDLNVVEWFLSCLFLWIVAFPIYCANRERLKQRTLELKNKPVIIASGTSSISHRPIKIKVHNKLQRLPKKTPITKDTAAA